MSTTNYYLRIIIIFLFAYFSSTSTSLAQQLAQYTQFSINPYILNPAIAGTENFTYAQASFRSQWAGFDGAPKTGYLTIHSPINKKAIGHPNVLKRYNKPWISAGGVINYDQAGPIQQTSFYGTFAYNIPLSAKGLRLSFGTNLGIKGYTYNPDGFTANLIDANDPYITEGYSQNLPDFSLGFLLYNKRFFIGSSAFQILENKLRLDNAASGTLIRHYYAMAGYKIIVHKDLYMVPYILVKTVPSFSTSLDVNYKAVYRNQYWIGASYRNKDSFSLFAGFLINNVLEMSYSYDLITSPLKNSTSGSYEVLVGYRFQKNAKVLCPDEFW